MPFSVFKIDFCAKKNKIKCSGKKEKKIVSLSLFSKHPFLYSNIFFKFSSARSLYKIISLLVVFQFFEKLSDTNFSSLTFFVL